MGMYGELTSNPSKVTHPKPEPKDEIVVPKHQDTNKDTKVSRHQQIDNTPDPSQYKEKIRMLLMSAGDNASSLRVNDEEKLLRRKVMRRLEDDNLDADNTEIMRLAIDYIFLEFMDNGDDSILAQIIRYIRDPINNA